MSTCPSCGEPQIVGHDGAVCVTKGCERHYARPKVQCSRCRGHREVVDERVAWGSHQPRITCHACGGTGITDSDNRRTRP